MLPSASGTPVIIRKGETAMPITESRKKANRKWDTANRSRYWQCPVRFPSSDKTAILARASDLGVPVSEYIRNLVYSDIDCR